jgi:adenylate cyclase
VERSAVTRKLAAILVADVVGFSRLMERDDAGTFSRLRDIRDRVTDPCIAANGGRLVKTSGDGMLIEFASADAALRCAVDVQRAMRSVNQSKRADDRIEFRIGINLGDIIVDGSDIAGDGVNVAARLEALAEPGGICVSAAVREQVHGNLDVAFDDIGEQQVKNIMRPIRVFAVGLDSSTGSTPVQGAARAAAGRGSALTASPGVARRWWTSIALALAASAIVALASRWSPHTSIPPEPPPMSLGLLPLMNASDDAVALQRLDSITRDMSTQLTRADIAFRLVPAAPTDVRSVDLDHLAKLARTIQVRYLLEVQARQINEASEVRSVLIDAASGEQVWTDSTC